ncbi:MAG: hypothetical protein JWQ09_1799 [Segetibacter sp.]|nr:hypothetical protein [Segetibacter sp.]
MARLPEVNFRLKPKDAKGMSLIYLQFLFNKQRLFFSFGQKIKPGQWNSNKQRVKNTTITTADGKHSLNDMLDTLERECSKIYNTSLTSGGATPEIISRHLKSIINVNVDSNPSGESGLLNLIERFINNEIKNKGKKKTSSTIKTYRVSKKSLKAFEAYTKTLPGNKNFKLDFDSITLDFFYRYVSFLEKNNYKANTLQKYIGTLKVFMGEAVDLGLTTNLQFKHRKFSVDREETDAVYLNEKELELLYNYDFSDDTRLERVRDLFIFGAWTGLRFSDYSNVKPENIVLIDEEHYIKIITQKTKELVVVPCNPVVLEIFEKYKENKNRLPNSISNQKFNEFLKEVCKAAELNEKGRLSTDPELELWKCISSHTARRSFATNYYLRGFPPIDLMKITGHSTEKVFLRYIKVTKLDTAKRLSQHNKMWTEKTLKAANTLLKAV